MIVSPELKQQVNDRLLECAVIINKAYGIIMPMPTVSYNLSGRSFLGMANYSKRLIKLNVDYLTSKPNEFIKQTVAHELAHIADSYMFELAGKRKVKLVGGRMKRDIHGESWKAIMRVLGLPPDRCSSIKLDTPIPERRQSTRPTYQYYCQGCGNTLQMGPKRHLREQSKPGTFNHIGCGRAKLSFVSNASIPGVYIQRTAPASIPSAKKAKEPSPGSKIYACWQLYQAFQDKYDRQLMISTFENEVGCTPAGASTYYATCKKLYNQS